MKITKQKLKQIIKEEIQKEGVFDYVKDSIASYFDKETNSMKLKREFNVLTNKIEGALGSLEQFKFNLKQVSNPKIPSKAFAKEKITEQMSNLRFILNKTDEMITEYDLYVSKGKNIDIDIDNLYEKYNALVSELLKLKNLNEKLDELIKDFESSKALERSELYITGDEYSPESPF